ncbi:hypothetical protein UFOVP410_77 [uncultured Caudovirales phage]|uniref:Lipoprotein n=1 Tax=uncultured Caudovirales phage TaxID=2100421 RepID=A0A6J5M3Q3_9CAUD|nr:hypothetical protein UFOVP410_77 [uncultured Caudovirales phage]
MKNLLMLVTCLSLSACGLFSSSPKYIVEDKPKLNLSNPEPLFLQPLKFKVLHKDNAASYFDELKKSSGKEVVFALTETDYANLAINMEKIKSYVKRQKKIIELYKNYYEGTKNDPKAKSQKNKEKY